jgi:DNA-binding NarL/FixJ family response regulator
MWRTFAAVVEAWCLDSARRASAAQAAVATPRAEGVRSPAIAEQLHVSVATIEVHRRNIMRKLGLRTVAELTKHAIRAGIVSL